MSDVALYRKYRPASFGLVKGQDAIMTTLANQVKNGLTKQAYIFVGQRGTGKTSTARILAKSMCCTGTSKPCGICQSCQMTDQGMNDDIRELDAASNNSVEDIRQITDECRYMPRNGNKRVYIIDEAHMLSQSAFNALLKVLEEPPAHVVFILATTEFSKIPETIASRCQTFVFKPIPSNIVESALTDICKAEHIQYDASAMLMISELSGGSMRDAISMLDQCHAFGNITETLVSDIFGTVNKQIIESITEKILDNDIGQAIDIVKRSYEQGKELSVIADLLFHHFLEMFISSNDKEMTRYMQIFAELSTRLKRDRRSGMIMFETSIVRACIPEVDGKQPVPVVQQTVPNDIEKRLNVLEKMLHIGKWSDPHYVPPDFMDIPGSGDDEEPPINIDMSKFIVIKYGCVVPIPVICEKEG